MLTQLGINAKKAQRTFMRLADENREIKNEAIKQIGLALEQYSSYIIEQNAIDVALARENGMSESMIDRLSLDEKRIANIAAAAFQVIKLDDPCGKLLSTATRPNGLVIEKVSVPLGVIAVIFEARPNVTVDAAVLCLKAGNSVILRGGKEAYNSNMAMVKIMREAITKAGMPADCIQLVQDTSRQSATALMRMNAYVDVLIPRGGAGLIKACVENSTVPVIETGTGNCHIYVDKDADLDMATEIIFNAKTSRPSVCNACESMVIHADVAEKVLPMIQARLAEKGVVIHGDAFTAEIIGGVVPATDEDFAKEYLSFDISCKIVSDISEAVDHIMKYTTGHSECIVTENTSAAEFFTANIDAAAVYVNASTRFTDGEEFGFGAEIGISTQKLHARGPLALPELTTMKYIIRGTGQVR